MPNTEVMNYSETVTGSIDFRKIMREARNEEKEKEKRSKNFIVHGLAEVGEQNEDIKENDVKIIKSFLHTVGTTSEPESFTRLGKPKERKKRTLKVVMKIKQEKEDVLANLKLLKGPVEEFGMISATDDYTSHEREQIKSWVKIAAEKSEEDSDKKVKKILTKKSEESTKSPTHDHF